MGLFTTPTPRTSAEWTASGACTSDSTARPKGATRRGSGGADMTNTTSAERSRDLLRNFPSARCVSPADLLPHPFSDGGHMSWTRNPGRVVGFWYLLLVLGGPLRLIYIPNKLFVHHNAAATASNIAAHELLFRFGMLSDLLGAVVLIFLVLAFYRLFKGVDQQLAVLLVIVGGVMPALINFVNVVSDAGALMFARSGGAGGGGGADFLSVFDKPQRDALVLLFLRLHHP